MIYKHDNVTDPTSSQLTPTQRQIAVAYPTYVLEDIAEGKCCVKCTNMTYRDRSFIHCYTNHYAQDELRKMYHSNIYNFD